MDFIVDKKNVIIAPGQRKTPVSLLHDDTCEELGFPYFLSRYLFVEIYQ